jgi:hypothetical protein
VRRGVEQADADVDAPVGQREHPAVAGQQVVAAPQLQVGVDPGVDVALGPVVLADRHADGALLVAVQAERLCEAAGGAVGGDHHLGAHVDRVLAVAAQHRAPDQPALDQRRDHLGGLPQLRPGLGRGPGQQLVQVGAGPGQPEGRELGELRPRQLDDVAAAVDLQPGAPRPALVLLAQAHGVQLGHRPGGEAVAADLVARVGLLLAQQHAGAAPGEVEGGRGTARAAADHQRVVGLAHLASWCAACLCESMHKCADWSVGRPVPRGKHTRPTASPPHSLALEA